jgi:hypothetical protein
VNVVYYVRPGERNEELRYSLRSLGNLPHERVWIIGHTPRWVTGVESIPGNRVAGGPQQVAIGNLRLACEHVEADSFVIYNDDFYVMEPIEAVPIWHRGPLLEWHRAGSYGVADREAYRRLREAGIPDPLDWTLHIPLVVERDRLADVLCAMDGRVPPEWRTMYGNLSGVTGERHSDVKVRRRSDPLPDGPFLSSQDHSFSWLRQMLHARFPEPSPHEVAA